MIVDGASVCVSRTVLSIVKVTGSGVTYTVLWEDLRSVCVPRNEPDVGFYSPVERDSRRRKGLSDQNCVVLYSSNRRWAKSLSFADCIVDGQRDGIGSYINRPVSGVSLCTSMS